LGEKQGERRRWTTASRLDRAIACPASTVLPEVQSEPGNSAIFGSAFHQLVECGALGERECRDKVTGAIVRVEWPKWVRRGIADKLANLPRAFEEIRGEFWPGGTHEVQGTLDGSHFEVASRVDEGGFPNAPTSIRLKIDYVQDELGDLFVPGLLPWDERRKHPLVEDLKTGRPSLPESMQVVGAAIWKQLISGAEGVWVATSHWPRYPKSNEPTRELQHLNAPALEKARKVLTIVREDAFSSQPTINPARDEWGEPVGQCKWCGSRPNCPAWKGKE
jgi:hypothetical protein